MTKASEAFTSDYTQTLHYGNGVFEGIRSYGNTDGCNIFCAREHFERLLYSAKKMHLNLTYSVDELVSIAYQLLDLNKLKDAYLRPLVYSGVDMGLQPSNKVNVFMAAWKWDKFLGDKPLDLMVSSYQRPNPRATIIDAKIVGNYTNSILATTEARKMGYDEALLLDMNGNVAEGPGANFFYEKDKVLYTPPKGQILPGITRRAVIEIAGELGLKVVEKHSKIEEVYAADTAFFTGTAVEIAPVKSINGKELNGKWEDSSGYDISLMYDQKVRFNEYQGLTII